MDLYSLSKHFYRILNHFTINKNILLNKAFQSIFLSFILHCPRFLVTKS